MKLLINTESLLPPITGIGTYTLNLLKQYTSQENFEAIECFSGHRFTTAAAAITQSEVEPAYHKQVKTKGRINALLRGSILAYRSRELLRNALLRLKSAHLKDFIYHEPNFILKRHKGPAVATIHDLSFISHPQYHPAKRVAWLTSELPKTLARADMLITDSEQVRRELIELFAVDEKKVRAIHLGAASRYTQKTAEQTKTTLDRYTLNHGQYLLFVGTLEPRKGVDTLVESWANLPAHLKREFPLVLAGAPGWDNKNLHSRIEQLKQSDGLKHLSFVPGSDLPELYAGATTLAYPSHYEGFGLPVLEAMSCGVPVICTADTSMSEITGEHALHIQAGNTEQLTEQMRLILEDTSLRMSLSSAALTRAKNFSWEKCARETQDIYRVLAS
ncbi:glycosyltransferase family 4 protein [Pseudomonas lactis]|uniref:glycosyltransferase family 4 protein n=1 Tax=Pseudomonas lactis TaxID=1615674 RepID=UPI00110C833B|nr:glycosyltransferase family 1 protein [Pseudomonas lactis]MBK3446134.1 glycosyltransferase family 4 protein [Pseudomonas lactis]